MDTVPNQLFADIPVTSEPPNPEPEASGETAAIGDPPGQLTLRFVETPPADK